MEFLFNQHQHTAQKEQQGQSLIEMLLALAVVAVVLPVMIAGMVSAREGKVQSEHRQQATQLLQEAQEALRSVREKNWNEVALPGTYYPQISGSSWALAAGSETIGDFSRNIVISNVQRDAVGGIVTSGGTNDPSTKKAVITVNWANPVPQTITSTEYLTRYLGNTATTQTSQTDFNGGSFNSTRSTSSGGGTVELQPGSGSLVFSDDYGTASNYTFDSNKLEVIGGVAQLKNQGTNINGNTANPDFSLSSLGWTFARTGPNVGQTGAHQTSGGNPGGYIQINMPADKNKTAGGYYYQPFTTTAANPTGTMTFQWRVTGYQSAPDSFRIYAFVENGSGSPTIANAIWDSGEITGTTGWSGTVTVNISSKITTPGTYYLKVATVVDYPNSTRGPFTVGFDNALITWSGATATYAADSPTIVPTTSFSPSLVSSWDSFTTTEITNGGSIRYQLSDDDGATWYYYNNGTAPRWDPVVLATDYNDATTINSKISQFPTTTGKIRVRAFLIGNGTQQVKLDQVTIGYTGSTGSNNGTFTSSSIDMGSTVAFNRFAWTESNTTNTTTQFQIATNTDNTTWDYVGPDGTASTYFTGGSGVIPLGLVSGRYFRYRIHFSSTNNDLPSVADITVNYSP